MRITTQKDGSILIEDRSDRFSKDWSQALQSQKVVMADGRPAVRRQTALGVMYLTIHPQAWETLKRLPRNRPMFAHRTKLCEFCGTPLKVAREYEGSWTFVCDTCRSTEIHGKEYVGGVRGAGEREKR